MRSGISALQGPHHVAQKFTRMTFPRKSASEICFPSRSRAANSGATAGLRKNRSVIRSFVGASGIAPDAGRSAARREHAPEAASTTRAATARDRFAVIRLPRLVPNSRASSVSPALTLPRPARMPKGKMTSERGQRQTGPAEEEREAANRRDRAERRRPPQHHDIQAAGEKRHADGEQPAGGLQESCAFELSRHDRRGHQRERVIHLVPNSRFEYRQHLGRHAAPQTVRAERAKSHAQKSGHGSNQQKRAIHCNLPPSGHHTQTFHTCYPDNAAAPADAPKNADSNGTLLSGCLGT